MAFVQVGSGLARKLLEWASGPECKPEMAADSTRNWPVTAAIIAGPRATIRTAQSISFRRLQSSEGIAPRREQRRVQSKPPRPRISPTSMSVNTSCRPATPRPPVIKPFAEVYVTTSKRAAAISQSLVRGCGGEGQQGEFGCNHDFRISVIAVGARRLTSFTVTAVQLQVFASASAMSLF